MAMRATSPRLPLDGVPAGAALGAWLVTLVLIAAVAFAAEGHALARLRGWERLLFALAALLITQPGPLRAAGTALALALFGLHARLTRGSRAAP